MKRCFYCGEEKPFSEYFTSASSYASLDVKVGAYCKQCHAEGKIEHGYGWYGDRFRSPEDTGHSLPG